MPTTFPLLAGVRMLPRVSVPNAANESPIAAATPDPLEEPYVNIRSDHYVMRHRNIHRDPCLGRRDRMSDRLLSSNPRSYLLTDTLPIDSCLSCPV